VALPRASVEVDLHLLALPPAEEQVLQIQETESVAKGRRAALGRAKGKGHWIMVLITNASATSPHLLLMSCAPTKLNYTTTEPWSTTSPDPKVTRQLAFLARLTQLSTHLCVIGLLACGSWALALPRRQRATCVRSTHLTFRHRKVVTFAAVSSQH
jgi:hypothetical protein